MRMNELRLAGVDDSTRSHSHITLVLLLYRNSFGTWRWTWARPPARPPAIWFIINQVKAEEEKKKRRRRKKNGEEQKKGKPSTKNMYSPTSDVKARWVNNDQVYPISLMKIISPCMVAAVCQCQCQCQYMAKAINRRKLILCTYIIPVQHHK